MLSVCGLFGSAPPVQVSAEDAEVSANRFLSVWSRSSYESAASEFLRASEAWITLGDPKRAADCLREATKVLLLLSENGKAVKALTRSIELDKGSGNSAGLAISNSLLAGLNREEGKRPQAVELSSSALEQARLSGDAKALAYALFAEGMLEFYTGDLDKSMRSFAEASAFSESTSDVRFQIVLNWTIGFGHARQGRPREAMAILRKAVNSAQSAGLVREKALALFGCGYVALLGGRKSLALKYYLEAEHLYPNDFEWIEKGKLYANIAAVFEEMKVFELAEVNYERAYTFYSKANFPLGKMATLPSFARMKYRTGDRAAAAEMLFQARRDAIALGSRLHIPAIDQMLAEAAADDGLFNESLTRLKDVRRAYTELNVEFPEIELSLGRVYEKMGDVGNARVHYQIGLEKAQQFEDGHLIGEAVFRLGLLDEIDGNKDQALKRYIESIRLGESSANEFRSAALSTSFFSTIQERYERAIDRLMSDYSSNKNESKMIEAFNLSEGAKARFLRSAIMAAEPELQGEPGELFEREINLSLTVSSKADELTHALKDGNVEQSLTVRRELNQLSDDLEKIRFRLAEMLPVYTASRTASHFNVQTWKSNGLASDLVFMSFVLGEKSGYLWLVSPESIESYVTPGRTQVIPLIERLRVVLAENKANANETIEEYRSRTADLDTEYKRVAKRLSRDLFGQVADKLKGKRIVLSAQGDLQFFPLGALPWPGDTSDEPIISTNEVLYSPSASVLQLIRLENQSERQAGSDLLVFSDPVFSNNDTRLTGIKMDSLNFAGIPGTFRSAQSLDKLPRLESSNEEAITIARAVGGFSISIKSGFDANRTTVLSADLGDYRMLHFATHGVIDEEWPELSGILLSLYDREGKRNDGGLIRLQDVYGMNLNSDLVVLSACDTGIGKDVRGEGLMSLTNAFLQAGSKTVVSSLWKVDDAATKELMTEFYRGMAEEGLTVSAALRQAQIKLYNDPRYRSPFYWAAFTMHGDYDRVPQISTRYARHSTIVGAIMFLLLGFYLFRVFRAVK